MPDGKLRAALGDDVHRVFVHTTAPEASKAYEALVTCLSGTPAAARVARLNLTEEGKHAMPAIKQIEALMSGKPDLVGM